MTTLTDLSNAVTRAFGPQLGVCYYAWWVPRIGSAGLYPVNTNSITWPTKLTDAYVSQMPILTDRAASPVVGGSPDPRLLGNGSGHPLNGHLKNVNLLFGDGHVELNDISGIQMEYQGNYYNFY